MSTASPAVEPNAFIGTTAPPADADRQQELGPAKPAWDALLVHLAAEHKASTHEWKCYSAKTGWALRILRGKRTIIWLSPCRDCFRASLILGGKAMTAARGGKLSARAKRALDSGQKYPEGTGIRFLIATDQDLGPVKELTAVKVEN